MAYQFVHIEVYSRRGSKGRSVDYVLDEADRRPGAHPHVLQPRPPTVLHGVTIEQLRKMHHAQAAKARQSLANGKDRAIRQAGREAGRRGGAGIAEGRQSRCGGR